MDAVLIQTSNFNQTNLASADAGEEAAAGLVLPIFEVRELAFELGLWFSSLESFLNVGNYVFVEENRLKTAGSDWTREFHLTHSSLAICSKLTFQLAKTIRKQIDAGAQLDSPDSSKNLTLKLNDSRIDVDDIYNVLEVLKDSILLNEALLRAAPLRFGEWIAWSHLLAEKLKNLPIVYTLIEIAETESGHFLPETFQSLLRNKALPVSLETDLKLVLPRFAKILKALSVIDRMLKNDEPLKPALLIFSRVYEQINELIKFVNNRLLRFPDEEDRLFDTLDGTAYAASIELRKVYNFELAGLAEMRPTPSIYARIETAYSLLNDSFQQTLVNFAQLIEPEIKPEEIFPNFQIKLKQSILLRQNLWEILQSVKAVEQNPEKAAVDLLYGQLNEFLAVTLHFLFYKDMETVERFIEEVLVTDNKKDLVPVLHRFGAYLETLFGQVNMRAALSQYPFDK